MTLGDIAWLHFLVRIVRRPGVIEYDPSNWFTNLMGMTGFLVLILMPVVKTAVLAILLIRARGFLVARPRTLVAVVLLLLLSFVTDLFLLGIAIGGTRWMQR